VGEGGVSSSSLLFPSQCKRQLSYQNTIQLMSHDLLIEGKFHAFAAEFLATAFDPSRAQAAGKY
jgi:hypothetical protein